MEGNYLEFLRLKLGKIIIIRGGREGEVHILVMLISMFIYNYRA